MVTFIERVVTLEFFESAIVAGSFEHADQGPSFGDGGVELVDLEAEGSDLVGDMLNLLLFDLNLSLKLLNFDPVCFSLISPPNCLIRVRCKVICVARGF